jgi:hypothetical protein
MDQCYACDCEIVKENASVEHILLNSCGGRLKSKKLLCKKCNSELGERYDAELAKQLNHFANILLIKREKGKPQPTEAINDRTGETYSIGEDGRPRLSKPEIVEEKKDEMVQLSVKANNAKELYKILKGLKRKYPQLDIDSILSGAQEKELYIDEPLHSNISVGGPEANQSIVKSAIDFYLFKQNSRINILQIISNLKYGNSNLDVEPINLEKSIYEIDKNSVCHFIAIIGDEVESVLYSYVEYFGIYGFIVKLNMDYTGPEIFDTYCFDVLKGKEVHPKTNNFIDSRSIRDYSLPKSDPRFDVLRERVGRVLTIAFKRQNDNEIGRIAKKSWEESLGKYPEGTIITSEIASELSSAVYKNMMPYILRNLKSE